ncbi:serine protease [Streptomyces sp. Je 1-79]|uniref:serpin family protein n=1 Tax=Streptomyces sp. Je 1-79 TaxID=2943847 RepID=UPI0021A76A94|nr:serpin family protein [Streptomyces sp. Je 1-79]MCT4352908.1 serine protease [Streptomyces sp. Je 1-79]
MTGSDPAVHTGAARELAARWLPRLGDGDFVCSPAGLWTALAAVASGARTETGAELRELLGVEGEAAAEAATVAGRRLAEAAGIAVATAVWSRVAVLDAFRRGLPDVGFGVLGDEAQRELDSWVRESTGGVIDALPIDLDGTEELVLVNALVLKARWLTAFTTSATRDAPFTDGYGDTTLVPTMHQRIPVFWAWRVGGTTVVELPCDEVDGTARTAGGEGAARVRFVLGAQGEGPAEVLPAAWAGERGRTRLAADGVALALPRFTLRAKIDVNEQLAALGVTRALRPGADFSALSPHPLSVSRVVQEALVTVAEEGVEAAAVTAVTMSRGAAPPRRRIVEEIAFDRPFGVVVLDATGEVPLFAGWQSSAPRYATTRASSSPS